MSGEEPSLLRFRAVCPEDARLLFEWRNDPQTRAASRDTRPLVWEQHVSWLEAALENPRRRIFIAEKGKTAVGTVRFDELAPGKWELSWTVAPQARGTGVGTRLVCEAVALIDARELVARVRKENTASLWIAERAGFAPVGQEGELVVFSRSNPS